MKFEFKDGTTFDNESGVIIMPNQQRIDVEPVLMDGHRNGDILFDSDGLVFFQKQLTLIKARTFDIKYAELKARQVLPIDNEGGPGIQAIEYRTFDQTGSAKIINNYADDLPRADVSAGPPTISPIRSVGVSYGWNHDEIMAARHAGTPLDARKARAARRAVEQTINDIAFFGDDSSGLPGIFNNPNIPQGAIVDPGAGTQWFNKTAEQILFDVNDAFADVFETTLMVEKPNKLWLPPSQYSFIMSHPRSTRSDTTIAQYLVNNSKYISSMEDIVPLNECRAANNPNFNNDLMVVGNIDSERLELQIPVELEFFPVQKRNLEYVIPGRARVGGVVVRYPLALSILEGL